MKENEEMKKIEREWLIRKDWSVKKERIGREVCRREVLVKNNRRMDGEKIRA